MSSFELIEKKKELSLLQRRNVLRQRNGLICYKPHAKQTLFHSHGDKKYRYLRTGNRFGKTEVGTSEDCAWAIGARLWLPEDDPDYSKGLPKRATKGLVVAIDWDKCQEIFTNEEDGLGRGKMWKYLPKDRIKGHHRNHSGRIDMIKVQSIHGGLSTIYFDTVQSFKKNEMSQESSNWDWVHIDEPIPEKMWKGISRGLVDANGSAWFCCTPLNEPWINDFFIPNSQFVLDEANGNVFEDKKVVIVGSMFDNPYLPKEAIEEFEGTLNDDEKACRIHGIPLSMAGMVYKEFDHNRHILRETPRGWKKPNDPPANYSIYYAIDPHPRTPHAVLFAAVAPTGQVFFFEELFQATYIEDLCKEIHAIIDHRHVVKAICDPLAYIENPIDGTTMADEFTNHGIFFQKATKELANGILQTREALKEPKFLYFSEHLNRTIWEFEHYMWDQKKPNCPVDKDDHMMENLYRLVLTELFYVPEDPEGPSYFPQASVGRIDYDDTLDRLSSVEKKAEFNLRYPH